MKTFQKVLVILITGAMVLTFAKAANAADPRPVTVTLRAADNISGVTMMQIAEDKNNPPSPVTFESVTVVNTAANSLWVRIQDRAGNWSSWVEIIVGGDPYQDVANFNTLPTPTPSAPSGGSGGGGGGGGFGGGGFGGGGGFAPPPTEVETSTVKAEEKIETKTVTATPTPTPTVKPEVKPTPTPSASPTPTITPTPSPSATPTNAVVKRPDLVLPSAPAVSKSLGNGLTQVSQKIANSAPIVSSSPPAQSAVKAPTINSEIGSPVKPLVSALPAKSQLTVSIVVNGKSVTLGKVTTNSKGEVVLPAVSSSKSGTFTVQMKTASGKTYFTKVKFSAKK